jgi:hypothetical protein
VIEGRRIRVSRSGDEMMRKMERYQVGSGVVLIEENPAVTVTCQGSE